MEVTIELLKEDRLRCRKSKATEAIIKTKLLTTLIGEAELLERSKNGLDLVALVKKFIKNIDDTSQHVTSANKLNELETEREALVKYLPVQLGVADFELMFVKIGFDNVKDFMQYLSQNHKGRYDGKVASTFIKNRIK